MDRDELKRELEKIDGVLVTCMNKEHWEVETYSNGNIDIYFNDAFSIKIASTTPWSNETWSTTVSTYRDVLILFKIFCRG